MSGQKENYVTWHKLTFADCRKCDSMVVFLLASPSMQIVTRNLSPRTFLLQNATKVVLA